MLAAPEPLASWLNATTQGASRGLVSVAGNYWAISKTAVSFGGTTWQPHGSGGRPLVSWDKARTAIGLEIVTLDVTLETGEVGGSLIAQARGGGLDGSVVSIKRAYLDEAGTVKGVLPRFEGRVQSSKVDGTKIVLSVESAVAILSRPFPKTPITPACANALYDEPCGVDRGAATITWPTVAAGSTRTSIVVDGFAAEGLYTDGVLVISGEKVTIRSHTQAGSVATLRLARALPFDPAVGTALTLTKGCDRSGATCHGRFSNLGRFRGFPGVPREGQ